MRASDPIEPSRWLVLWLGLVAVGVPMLCGMNRLINPYCLFGDSRFAYANDREDKYLLTLNYVPARFEGLLARGSITLNRDPTMLPRNLPRPE